MEMKRCLLAFARLSYFGGIFHLRTTVAGSFRDFQDEFVTMSLQTLKDLFIRELRGLYVAEFQMSEALPRFIVAASNDELRSVLESHDHVTKKHIARLERIFQRLGVSECGSKCHGVKGLIEDVDAVIDEDAEDSIRDAGLIAAIQRIEHCAIAAYGAARMFADTLGFEDLAWTLTETLEDEREADEQLSALANTAVNLEAAEAPEVG
jgi:ferritin-like metal-binding protein YciE